MSFNISSAKPPASIVLIVGYDLQSSQILTSIATCLGPIIGLKVVPVLARRPITLLLRIPLMPIASIALLTIALLPIRLGWRSQAAPHDLDGLLPVLEVPLTFLHACHLTLALACSASPTTTFSQQEGGADLTHRSSCVTKQKLRDEAS